jgi:hypothetical protein
VPACCQLGTAPPTFLETFDAPLPDAIFAFSAQTGAGGNAVAGTGSVTITTN